MIRVNYRVPVHVLDARERLKEEPTLLDVQTVLVDVFQHVLVTVKVHRELER